MTVFQSVPIDNTVRFYCFSILIESEGCPLQMANDLHCDISFAEIGKGPSLGVIGIRERNSFPLLCFALTMVA